MSQAAKLMKEQKNLLPVNSPVPNRRILVVDDEPEIAKGLERILSPSTQKVVSLKSSRQKKDQGDSSPSEFEVVVVNGPKAALEEIDASIKQGIPFALGFFDVMLGDTMDGIELVKEVMDRDPHIFSVFVTAYHDRSVDAIGEFLGEERRERWDYINKPFSEGEILQKARNATSLWDLNRLKDWQSERLNEAHQLLVASEKQNAIAAIGRSVAHEFGNLLTHIIGHAEIAKFSEDIKDIKNSLDVILKAGQTASSVLKNFRDLNENDDKEEQIEVCNLMRPIDEALELMQFRFRRHGIHIVKTGISDCACAINKNALVQVLANLFINALYVLEGQSGEIQVSLNEDDEFAYLEIKDNGPGIPEEILDKVTNPLFTTKGKHGSGLGLAICKEIIEIEHHGRFKIENHPDGGAVVKIKIPKHREV